MLKRISDFFAGVKMTAVSGVCLAASLVMLLADVNPILDPAWITVVLSGYPLLYLALTRLFFEKWISSALLISMAMVASLSIGELFAAGEVAFIMAIGAILEDRTVARAKKGLSQLIALAPQEGRRLTAENEVVREEKIPAEQIQEGDLLRILPGEKIPVDGVIVEGQTSVDQSVMTGESLPADKEAGDEVYCGTLNCFGAVDIRATKVGADSSLQKLIRLVEEAEEKKAPVQRTADKWSVWLVPIALFIAVAAAVINWLLGVDLTAALTRGVTVLVVFCPCALALATPVSVMAAIGQAAKHGVIIKSGEALEKMGKVDTIAFDKTGTLTFGAPKVSDVIVLEPHGDDRNRERLLELAAAVESRSEHPLGKAIVAFAAESGVACQNLPRAETFHMVPGKGVRAEVAGKNVFCGSSRYLKENGIALNELAEKQLAKLQRQGKACILIGEEGVCMGMIGLSDTLRPDAKAMIQKLSELGAGTCLLTGDSQRTACYLAEQAGISNIRAQLLPGDKAAEITRLQAEGKMVCMIGDGVNDAPALKTAYVGAAMGSMGSDIAVEAADIALVSEELSRIPYLTRLSRSALNTIRGNIAASMCINAIAVGLSVLGLLNPVTGALVHNAGSVLVVLNGALLYDRNFEE